MYLVRSDDQLECSKCWFTSIERGEMCISDAPDFRSETARDEIEQIRHWRLSRPDHPDSCYERELREWSSSPVSVPLDVSLSCDYCGHAIRQGTNASEDKVWLPLNQDSQDLKDIELLRKESGFRVRALDGDLLGLVPLFFHDGCPQCGPETNCHKLYAQAAAKSEAPIFEWSDEPTKDYEEEEADFDPPPAIAERVRFWEEQDEINKALTPRVIRQRELLSNHIREHENLPLVVALAVQQAADEIRQRERLLYESALETARAEFEERFKVQQRQHDEALAASRATFAATLEAASRRARNLAIISAAGAIILAALIAALIATMMG